MKNLIITILSILVLSCSKENNEPDYSTQVAGQYNSVSLQQAGQQAVRLPYNGVYFTFLVTRTGINKVVFTSVLTQNGKQTKDNFDCKVTYTTTETLLIEESTSIKLATISGNTLTHTIPTSNVTIYATR